MADVELPVRFMTETMLGLAGGLALAHVHLSALGANVRLYLDGGPVWRPLALHLTRLAVVAGAFVSAAAFGAPALVAALAGFTLGRVWRLGARR